MQAGDVEAGRMGGGAFGHDGIEIQGGRVDDAGARWAPAQDLGRHQGAGVEADRAGGDAVAAAPDARSAALDRWADAPAGRLSHPRAEHLLPLMVAAGASEARGTRIYAEHVLETAISGFSFA